MQIEELDYELPGELIAQHPMRPRDQARLMVVERGGGRIEHARFRDLPSWLQGGDCLVVNDTRVLPARLIGRRAGRPGGGGGGRWEGLYLGVGPGGLWQMLCRGRQRPGQRIELEDGQTALVLRRQVGPGRWLAEPQPAEPAEAVLARLGHVPLPPYIRGGRDEPGDRQDYQTIFARRPGAVAAPTAALHFTDQVLKGLTGRGVEVVSVTLHVGPGTFQPIRGRPDQHQMESEWCELTAEAARRLRACQQAGRRVVAVGTTAVRVLESAAAAGGGTLTPWQGRTNLFIRPPYRFRAVDALITNFHLPRTTLLALVFAFAGQSLCRRAYQEAIERRYRFYSYGDAMLIL